MLEQLQEIAKAHTKKLVVVLLLSIWYYLCLPAQLFNKPTATVVVASNHELLGAVIAKDGQWRFPPTTKIPEKFKYALLHFEDAHFYQHQGFNPVSMTKALYGNITTNHKKRGGSTLSQQVIRLSRNGKRRTYFEKVKELILATRLELRYGKEEILNMYASHAPFGGNVVGLEMASWRYFGLKPAQLSWAESATLAVLPNAPSLIYPGKNKEKLKKKRNRLLLKLKKKKVIDALTYQLALEEPLPNKPFELPKIAPHLVQNANKKHEGALVVTSIDVNLQKQVNSLVAQHHNTLKQNQVHNMAVLVMDVKTKKVLAYIGNSPTDKKHQKDVDNIQARRSTGSVLKPLLYANMLQSGDLLPTQLVADIPTEVAGYVPKNFDGNYDGAVPADKALTRSLNIPAVRMLQKYGVEKFVSDLQSYQVKHIDKNADHYGLSLILGGAEASLWDITKVYGAMASTVNHYTDLQGSYYTNEFEAPSFLKNETPSFGKITKKNSGVAASNWYLTLSTLTNVNRPEIDQAWKYYASSKKIAWKTGTSYGNRDAWSVGVTPNYVVGVWVGNSDGEGRADLTGVGSAAPLMFKVFDALPTSEWFTEPYDEMVTQDICELSGFLALPICKSVQRNVSQSSIKSSVCPYHKEILVDQKAQFRVNANCEPVARIVRKSWFVLPPLMAYYYQNNNAKYSPLPPYKNGCSVLEQEMLQFVIPIQNTHKITLTKGVDQKINPIVFKLVHRNENATVFWYLDNQFIKSTQHFHELQMKPSKGTHVLMAIDEQGNEIKKRIEVL